MDSPRHGNLTGNPRKVKDTAVELYTVSTLWKNHRDEGIELIRQITELKLQWLEEKVKRQELENQMQLLCDKLETTYYKLEKLVQKLDILTSHMEGMAKLEEYQEKNKIGRFANIDESDTSHMFLTWPTRRFYLFGLKNKH
ncbi:uncharacterized protein LOC136028947 isoform X2 [Artemia franciscana]|uniref:Uncharacterized protein n=1 Tax=Artemia franciscana TaxID=6661 RepID=A0AA88HFQ3_ARTSF|nr:hypothetical protein QYM36_015688 [Artemia franciscana]KAK2708078.1 hypothetical protein QYM36_015688 [Artemia franciscana]